MRRGCKEEEKRISGKEKDGQKVREGARKPTSPKRGTTRTCRWRMRRKRSSFLHCEKERRKSVRCESRKYKAGKAAHAM
jgi:hypothetical protein